MTRPECAVVYNLINTHTHTHKYPAYFQITNSLILGLVDASLKEYPEGSRNPPDVPDFVDFSRRCTCIALK